MAPISKQSSGSGSSTASDRAHKAKKGGKTQWTDTEEAQFLHLMNSILSSHLRAEAKKKGVLVERGSDGVNKHWKAMYKRMATKKP